MIRDPFAIRTDQEMKDVLMSPESVGPLNHYYMVRGGSTKKNITVIESGDVGGEYIKTYGHYHIDDLAETYTILSGDGIVLLQSRKKGSNGEIINNEVESVTAVFVKTGSVVNIPAKAGHLLINIGHNWLVTKDDSPVALTDQEQASWPIHADYSAVKEMRGFAYYVVNKDGLPDFVKNPNYKNIPNIEKIYT